MTEHLTDDLFDELDGRRRQYIYALSVQAQRPIPGGGQVSMLVGSCLASSTEEALGIALQEGRERLPESAGYSGHSPQVSRVPDRFVEAAVRVAVRDG